MDEDDNDHHGGVEFWNVSIDRHEYKHARGWLVDKPTPYTVTARIWFPRMEPHPGLSVSQTITISAYCSNKRWMRDIKAEVKEVIINSDDSRFAHLLLHRKAKPSS